jgi:2-amino-4-hydroxy-6-hydroxymethyldihydropteridine diphosphokinase
MNKHQVFLLLGSNMGNAQTNLKQAVYAIQQLPTVLKACSSIYQTKAWGNTNQADFLNAAILIETELNPHQLLEKLLAIETEMGRTRNQKWEERIIDIDILFFDNLTINAPDLTVPHPHIPNRRFTLVPMLQIAPNFIHPVLNKNIQLLLNNCIDDLSVTEIDTKWN